VSVAGLARRIPGVVLNLRSPGEHFPGRKEGPRQQPMIEIQCVCFSTVCFFHRSLFDTEEGILPSEDGWQELEAILWSRLLNVKQFR
jgi:hypothetical protein